MDQSHDMNNTRAMRQCNEYMYGKFTDHKFLLYMYFLSVELPKMGTLNVEMQKKSNLIVNVYNDILRFLRAFVHKVVIADHTSVAKVCEPENLILPSSFTIDEAPPIGEVKFQEYRKKCVDNSLLPIGELTTVLKNCCEYAVTVGRVIVKRYPELEFITAQCKFLVPEKRKYYECDVEQ